MLRSQLRVRCQVEISLIDDEIIGEERTPDLQFSVEIKKSPEYTVWQKPVAVVTIQDADHSNRSWMHDMCDTLAFKLIMFGFTIYALFGEDVVSFHTYNAPTLTVCGLLQWKLAVDYDQGLDDIELGLIITSIAVFLFEIIAMSVVEGVTSAVIYELLLSIHLQY